MAGLAERPPVDDWATDFDHFDRRFIDDPYPVFDELRQRCPVARSERYGPMVVLTRYDDIADAAHDTETFSSRRVVVNEVPTDRHGLPLPPINLDPPNHAEPRRVMLPFFNPVATKRWEGAIREICQRLLDALEGRDHADLAVEYAQALPGDLTALMLGVPASDTPQFRAWLHDLLEVGPTQPDVLRSATAEMSEYLRQLLERRRAEVAAGERGNDVVTYLLDQTIDGAPIPDDELVNMLFLLLVAGIDTTWSAIGSSLLHLATHPDDRRRLAADPSLVPTATEEFLRAFAPVNVARVATRDTEVRGCPVQAGSWVMLAFNAANRDPEAFEQADEVVIDRERNRHAAFGLGIHRCLGSNLARLEMNVAIEMLLERFPEFTLEDPDGVTFSAGQIRGPRRVPVRLGAGAP